MPEKKKLNLSLDGDLVAWASYAAGLGDQSVTAYINSAVRREMDEAPADVAAGYKAFLKARGNGKDEPAE